jgi:hypothetical protein
MFKYSILICLLVLSFSAGNAYCVNAVKSSYGTQAQDDKAAVAKSTDTTGKAKASQGGPAPVTRGNDKILSNTRAEEVTGGAVHVSSSHLLLEKVDGNIFYAKDGSTVEIPKNVRIIDNTRNGQVVNAELTYINGELIEAMIR